MTLTKKIVEKIERQIGKEKVSTKKSDILSYTSDYWPISLHWILEKNFPFLPSAVVWPNSTDDVKKIVKICFQEKTPLYPYGGGSGVLGALTPEKTGIVIDLKKIRNVKIFEDDLLVECGSGINGYYIESFLNDKGFTLGNIPQSLYPSTVGGWVGTKATGQFSTRYGGIEYMVAGLEVVTPSGEVATFKPHPRTATGPDIRQIFIGSEGTLGVITRVWLKIWPYPEKRTKLSFVSDDLKQVLDSVKNIMRSGARPAVVRIYDKIETKRHFYRFDEAIDKIVTILIVEGNSILVDAETKIIKEIFKGKDLGEDLVNHWLETRFNVKEAAEFVPLGVVFDTIEVAIQWSKALSLYEKVIHSMKQVKGVLFASAHASHFYPQGVCFYFTFAGTAPRGKKPFDFYNEVWRAAMDATVESGGTISHHHGIGRQRIPWMNEELSSKGVDLLKKIKKCVDENNIMNPGDMGV